MHEYSTQVLSNTMCLMVASQTEVDVDYRGWEASGKLGSFVYFNMCSAGSCMGHIYREDIGRQFLVGSLLVKG